MFDIICSRYFNPDGLVVSSLEFVKCFVALIVEKLVGINRF